MKLSSRAFNNIVIFAMLAMIMLFNLDAWLPKPSIEKQTRLINEQDMLLRIDMNSNRIERIGTDWRIVFESGASASKSKDAYQLVQRWQSAELKAVSTIPRVVDSTDVNVWLAAQDKPANLILQRTDSGTYVTIAEQYYQIVNADYSALVF